MHTLISPVIAYILTLNSLRQIYTLLHIAILHQFKDHITFTLAWVKAFIALAIVLLIRNHTVFTLCHFKIGFSTRHTERIRFATISRTIAIDSICMNRNKEISFGVVGYIGSSLQRDKYIRFARIDDFHVGTVALYKLTESQRHFQVDILFHGVCTWRACIFSAMAGIDNKRKALTILGDSSLTQQAQTK